MKYILIILLASYPFLLQAQSTAAGVQLEPGKTQQEVTEKNEIKMKQYYFVCLPKAQSAMQLKIPTR